MRNGGSRTRIVIAVLAALAALTVLLWGSGQSSTLVHTPQGSWGEPRGEGWLPRLPEIEMPTGEQGPEEMGDPNQATDLGIDIITVLFMMCVVVAVLLLVRWLLRQRAEEEERLGTAEEDELVALLEATDDEIRYRALAEGDPRNGVVACWVALEEAAQRSGLRSDRSETATELAARVLRRWEVDQGAIDALSEAYREARFSRHPVTEEQLTTAVGALEKIHADLRRRIEAENETREAQARFAHDSTSSTERP